MNRLSAAAREVARVAHLSFALAPIPTICAMILAPLTSISYAGLATVQRALVDSSPSTGLLQITLVVVGGAAVLSAILVLGRLESNLWSITSARVSVRMRADSLHLIDDRLDFEELASPDYADKVELARRKVPNVVDLAWVVYGGIMSVVGLTISLWLLLSVDPRLAVVVIGTATSLAISSAATRRTASDETQLARLTRQERRIHEHLIAAEGVQEIRQFRAHEQISGQASKLWMAIEKQRFKTDIRDAFLKSVGWLVLAASIAIGVAILGDEVRLGKATNGDLVLLITVVLGLRDQLAGITARVASVGSALPTVQALRLLRDRAKPHEDSPVGGTQRLRSGIYAESLEFRYRDSSRVVLSHVDLSLPAGSIVAIVGPNGAGKSTLANILLGVLTPTSGSITADGFRLDAGWARTSSGAFQDFMKPPLTVGETVGIGEPTEIANAGRINEAIRSVGGDRLIAGLPQGIGTLLSDRSGVGLSHGQWQTLALARSSMRSAPRMIVLDEPTAALDAYTEKAVFTDFVSRGRTLAETNGTISIFVSHRYSATHLADIVLVVDAGTIAECGTPRELISRRGRYYDMYELQRSGYID